jgi:hypothetical protein
LSASSDPWAIPGPGLVGSILHRFPRKVRCQRATGIITSLRNITDECVYVCDPCRTPWVTTLPEEWCSETWSNIQPARQT